MLWSNRACRHIKGELFIKLSIDRFRDRTELSILFQYRFWGCNQKYIQIYIDELLLCFVWRLLDRIWNWFIKKTSAKSAYSIMRIKSSINKDFKEHREIYQSEKLLFNTAGFCRVHPFAGRVQNINHSMKKNLFKK